MHKSERMRRGLGYALVMVWAGGLSLVGCAPASGEPNGRDGELPRLLMEPPRDESGAIVVMELDDAAWRERLSPEAYFILRQDGTERPWTSPLLKEKRAGVYACRASGVALFDAKDKFDSGTGWPSFTRPISEDRLTKVIDRKYGMVRIEVRSAASDGHLGHVFEDGPAPTGLRYCINGDALFFVPADEIEQASAEQPATQPADAD
ncbi:MAG: peptide-methionine (R)-S-oxide reductase MsrB [Planctomycetota bacterium]